MSSRPQVLLVAPTTALARALSVWLTEGGYDVSLVSSFAAAKVQLLSGPHLVISEVRLGEYNGLHLASRAQANAIPVVVIGGADDVLERDARELGVLYVHDDIDRGGLRDLADRLTANSRQHDVSIAQGGGTARRLAFVTSGELTSVRVPPRKRN